jgi:hypothetical protein
MKPTPDEHRLEQACRAYCGITDDAIWTAMWRPRDPKWIPPLTKEFIIAMRRVVACL